jgi:hypothetical protein
MADITVKVTGASDDELTYEVQVSEAGTRSRHVVTVQRADVDALGDRYSDPAELVRRSFEFLLEREPKESILARFDLRDISRYFPEFDRDLLRPES